MDIHIGSIETSPGNDPFHPGEASWTALWIDAMTCDLKISQEYGDGTKLVWHGADIMRRLPPLPGGRAVRNYLKGEAAQSLIRRIHAGFDGNWLGNGFQCILNDDAMTAVDELVKGLEGLQV